MHSKLLQRVWALALAGVVAVLATTAAQAQTPEGTVITNQATVNWTDANSNTYAPVNASVNVTVGFQAGVDVVAAAATVNPTSPSTGDTLFFNVQNIGNGADTVTISEGISVGGIITVTGYRYGATTYASLAALNAALPEQALGNTITIKVVYDVIAGQGGQSTVYTLTATSRRDGGVSDADATTVTPSESIAVAVTPDGGQNLQRLPSNGTNYTFTFAVQNNGDGPEDFDLLASNPGAVITIVSVNGDAGDSTQISLASGASTNIDVIYSVGDVAAGSVDTLFLRARSVSLPATFDDGFADLTVIRPSVSITKAAYRDDQLTPIGAGTVVPGEFIQYLITVTNNGDADASTVHIDDLLPGQVTYDSNTPDAAGWTFTINVNDVDADLAGTLAPSASRFFWLRVQIN
ncbi:MAG: DUF11 domain-containing protein [Gemmatimonadota bacterium]|nr:MAG: DUF11 domain-containing protein [Gemmatimonadota bacterium]